LREGLYIGLYQLNSYEFDFGSEWTRAKCLDTCELGINIFLFL